MIAFLSKLFDTSDFPARWHCGRWTEGHGWLHILSDLGVWSAYFAIPVLLVYFVRRRRDVPFPTVFLLFGAFILTCGSTHFMEAAIFWWPAYRLAGLLKLATAAVSWATVLATFSVIPKALALRSPAELEGEVRRRTEELARANDALRAEVGERARAEAALRASEERYRRLSEGNVVGIGVSSADGRWLEANDELLRVTGRDRTDLDAGRVRWAEMTPPEWLPLDERGVAEANGRGACAPYEKEYLRPDGSRVPILIGYSKLESRPGEYVVFVLDLTSRREAERRLRESEERFRTLADAIPQLAWAARPDGHIDWYNRRWYEYTGTTPEQMEGWGWQSVHDPAELPKVLERWRASIASGEPFDMTFPLKGSDGEFRPFLTRVMPLRDGAGRVVRWFGTNTDVSEQKRSQQALRESEERYRTLAAELEVRVAERTAALEEANAALEAFGYSVSHDLRAPLRAMQSLASVLVEDYSDRLDDHGREFARRIAEAAAGMDRQILDLLEYGRLSRADLRPTAVDLGGVVDEAVERLDGDLRQTELVVERPLPTVLGHRPTLVQILSNLLSNAAKFVAPGETPHVRVRAEPHGGRVRLWVEDDGIGIAPQHRDRIFRVFERLHGPETYPGTGIGLAIVRKGAERMGGSAGAESEVGKGSRFWVELPGVGPAGGEGRP